jgi:hypothetical protein
MLATFGSIGILNTYTFSEIEFGFFAKLYPPKVVPEKLSYNALELA